jgi:uncharacterized protein DUF3841
MILWTIQSQEAWAELQQEGVLRAQHRHIMEATWLSAYEWMAEKMGCRIGAPPEPKCLPIWAWRQWEGTARKRPDLRAGGHLHKGERGVRIEFEQPDDGVLLSDFSLWHYVLNYWYLPSSTADGEALEKELALRRLSFFDQKPVPHAEYHARIVSSWNLIFDLGWIEPDIVDPSEKKAIQATVWELRRDQVRHHKRFISR